MNRGTIIGATGGLIAGVSLATLALAAPSFALFNGGSPSVAAPMAGQVTLPMAGQARWGTIANLADLVAAVSPSVVEVDVRAPNQMQQLSGPGDNPFEGTPFRDFFSFGTPRGQGGELPDQLGSGSGFFIEGGYIVTNNHVVDNASKVTVVLQDGRQLTATVVGTDARTDLAVLKVSGSDLPRGLPWGDSNRVRPGDSVFAMGSPFGLGNSVTAGIVSARGRNINSGSYDDFIQVDAPINRGNSGGPLFDETGGVIGVNSQIFSPTGGNVGIGFSIPADLARGIVDQIIRNGSVQRGWLGVEIGPVTPEIAQSLNIAAARGAMVQGVNDNSPAARAGLKEADVILRFGDRDIREVRDLTRAVADTPAGTTRDVRILRDGREQTVKVNIAALKDTPTAPTTLSDNRGATPDASGASLSLAELGLGLTSSSNGLVVSSVKVNSPAADQGIQVGDRLLRVNQTEATSVNVVKKTVDDAKKQGRDAVMLQIERMQRLPNGMSTQRRFVGVPFSDG